MALLDESAKGFLFCKVWNNSDGSELAESLDAKYLELLLEAKTKNKDIQIKKIFGVEGPGSFTGLRVSSAFLKGLSTALSVPLVGISSYDLFAEPFAFSLRPAKAAKLSLEECIEKQFKFLQVNKNNVEVLAVPSCKKVLGLKGDPYWPNAEELLQGVQRSLSKNIFELNYGYTPEFVQS